MALYFLDTEFHEFPNTIDLISIGIVCDDGREFYAQNTTANLSQVNSWVRANVLPKLKPYGHSSWRTLTDIRRGLQEFFRKDPNPIIWGYYADYDWVIFCWTYAGIMAALPPHMPKFCRDLRQMAEEHQIPDEIRPPESKNEHNALADAHWNKSYYDNMMEYLNQHV